MKMPEIAPARQAHAVSTPPAVAGSPRTSVSLSGPRYTARERHSEIISEYWRVVQQKHTATRELPSASRSAASNNLDPPKTDAPRLPKTSAILQRLALRRVAELAPLTVPGRGLEDEGLRGGPGPIRPAKTASRSAARAKRASPYKRSPAHMRTVAFDSSLPPGPPTSELSADLGCMGLGSPASAAKAAAFPTSPTAHAGNTPSRAAARRRSPRRRAAAPHEPTVVHVSGSEAMRGCGGARGPIERLARREEVARLGHVAEVRERRRLAAREAARKAVREAVCETGTRAQEPRPGSGPAARAFPSAPAHFSPGVPRPSTSAMDSVVRATSLTDLTRTTASSRGTRPLLNHRLPPLPGQSAKHRIRFKPGFEGLLDSPCSSPAASSQIA